MKKWIPIGFVLCLVLIGVGQFLIHSVYSDELDDVTKQLNDLTNQLNSSINATRPLESQLAQMQQQITDIKNRVTFIEQDVAAKKANIAQSEADISTKTEIFNEKVRDYYIQTVANNPMYLLLASHDAGNITQILAYQKATSDQDKAVITNIALSIADLEQKKAALEAEETRLVSVKAELDQQSAKLDTVIQGAKAYQASLSSQIAQLSAKQQQLIAAKLGSLGLPTSAYTTSGGCSSDLTNGKDPGFSPKFGAFSFGVPHRVGMSQYGAKGRADAGQSTEDILHAYYNADLNKGYGTGYTIHVVGDNEFGEHLDNNWNIEDYVKHIYEMPTNWNPAALRAQAVAARTYALAYTNNGSSTICPTQDCQVVKTELNSQAWIDAVNATAGWVLTSGGQPIKAWFSSTAGGYFHSSSDVGWSSTSYTKTGLDASGSVGSFSDLQNNAYDKSSPWFYCDWGSRSSYSNTAWLKPEELADIANVIMLAKNDSSTQPHLAQPDKPNPDGTDTWDAGRVQQELKNRGITPFTSVDSVSVNADFGSGTTTNVQVSGNGMSQSFNGTDFKNFFNLRAPSNINIVGPLYNIEKR